MRQDEPIWITGAAGMVGAALTRHLRSEGYTNLLTPTRSELDLCSADAVQDFVVQHRPKHAFLLAAKVGGIAANIADPVGFLDENLRLVVNQLSACAKAGVEKVLFLGSTCIYPRECSQPMTEDSLLTGPLEPTNEGYALAKIAGLRLAQSYQKQMGMQCVLPMPCNIYGTGDHFDLTRCHVLSALVKRFCDAVDQEAESVTLWGTGSAKREFIHVEDAVRGMLHLFDAETEGEVINLGPGNDVSISELAGMIAEQAGFEGQILWDTTRPDGMPRKCTDNTRLKKLGFEPRVSLCDGIAMTIQEYRQTLSSNSYSANAA
ncbi:GDP-L-fucose synthase family protein [Rhodopirellula bahusiensis]|uniref:GDP-L-fucose synthase n=1 Tax=Rhodopirellula bahusiensis TaxID=2014065 RepID=A0A2G1W900_9BACT|nr:GDP-L-fucose synthase [Rhodopirellula bahusiensis]PHQ35491.1 GDP-fucose synthetase [Rhodopirellula bahusiensis]